MWRKAQSCQWSAQVSPHIIQPHADWQTWSRHVLRWSDWAQLTAGMRVLLSWLGRCCALKCWEASVLKVISVIRDKHLPGTSQFWALDWTNGACCTAGRIWCTLHFPIKLNRSHTAQFSTPCPPPQSPITHSSSLPSLMALLLFFKFGSNTCSQILSNLSCISTLIQSASLSLSLSLSQPFEGGEPW